MKLTNTLINVRLNVPVSKTWRLFTAVLMVSSLSHCAQFSAGDTATVTEPSIATEQQNPPENKQSEQSQTAQPAAVTDTDSVSLPVVSKPDEPKPELDAALREPFQQAKQLMQNEDYQAALMLLQPLAQQVPDAAGVQYNLALCYWQLQQVEPARQQLTALIERQPDYVEAANLLGIMARQAGNFNQARRHWLDALAHKQDFASAHKNLGFLYELYLAKPEQARYHYQQYQQITADPMAEAWLSLLEQQE